MSPEDLGNVGELVAQTYFVKMGYEVYIGQGGTYYDFIAVKAKGHIPEIVRVEVKSTQIRNKSDSGWIFNIRKSHGDLHFDNTKVDVLCCYIGPLDALHVIDAKDVTQKREYLILDTDG